MDIIHHAISLVHHHEAQLVVDLLLLGDLLGRLLSGLLGRLLGDLLCRLLGTSRLLSGLLSSLLRRLLGTSRLLRRLLSGLLRRLLSRLSRCLLLRLGLILIQDLASIRQLVTGTFLLDEAAFNELLQGARNGLGETIVLLNAKCLNNSLGNSLARGTTAKVHVLDDTSQHHDLVGGSGELLISHLDDRGGARRRRLQPKGKGVL